jgi:hypothetical protein
MTAEYSNRTLDVNDMRYTTEKNSNLLYLAISNHYTKYPASEMNARCL